jgi:autonomous glycyl radical cofactor GrcA
VESCVLGVNVGGTKVAIGLFDEHRRLPPERRYPSNHAHVAGYNAFFNVLSRETQDDIIERTEQVL